MLFPVILPAEYCRKRKQCNPDCHKPAPADPRTVSNAAIVTSEPVSIFPAASVMPRTPEGQSQVRNRTDNNRIPEGSRHIDISLTHRVIRRCSRCRNCRRSHTGFVGKYTSCHTITHCIHHGSDNRSAQTAAYRFYRKCHLKNHQNACRQIRNISDNDNNSTDHIKIAINGTTTEETFEMDLIPPTMISRASTVITIPVRWVGT